MSARRIEIEYDVSRDEFRLQGFYGEVLEHEYWNADSRVLIGEFLDDNPSYKSSKRPELWRLDVPQAM